MSEAGKAGVLANVMVVDPKALRNVIKRYGSGPQSIKERYGSAPQSIKVPPDVGTASPTGDHNVRLSPLR